MSVYTVYIHIYASTEIYCTFTALGKYQKLSHIFPLLYGPCSSNHISSIVENYI